MTGAFETLGSASRGPDNGSLTHGSARSLLITILGEFVWPSKQPVWTSTLVYILKRLGIEEQTARQAIARASASDWIVPERRGREVCWKLTPKLIHIFETGSARVYSLSDPFTGWDSRWLALLTTIPQALRATRRPLYAGLSWAGLGNPAPGLWLTPHVERAQEVGHLLEKLNLNEHTFAFVGNVDAIGIPQEEIVERGWDLDTLKSHYEEVWMAMTELQPSDGDDTLLTHIRLSSEYQELPRTDPQLPEALLPDWVGRRVARRIEALRARWEPTAQARYAELNSAQ